MAKGYYRGKSLVSLVQIFVEGNSSLKLPLIQFVARAVPSSRGSIGIQLGKNKDQTIKDFLRTLHENPNAKVLLLVDSDAPDDGKLLEKLKRTSTWRGHAPKIIRPERITTKEILRPQRHRSAPTLSRFPRGTSFRYSNESRALPTRRPAMHRRY
jgi:hypothetical protein